MQWLVGWLARCKQKVTNVTIIASKKSQKAQEKIPNKKTPKIWNFHFGFSMLYHIDLRMNVTTSIQGYISILKYQ